MRCPLAIIGRTIIRNAAVATLANRNPARTVITDVAIDIRVNKILSRAAVVAHSFGEFFPITRAVGVEYPRRLKRCRIKRGPTQRIPHSVFLKNDWSMAGHGHVQGLRHYTRWIDRA